MKRESISENVIEYTQRKIIAEIDANIISKGAGSFSSRHEILGSVTEEYYELIDAVHSKDSNKIEEELLDIIGAAAFGLASLYNNSLDW